VGPCVNSLTTKLSFAQFEGQNNDSIDMRTHVLSCLLILSTKQEQTSSVDNFLLSLKVLNYIDETSFL
jgi:negative regulator of replication initiation